MKKLLQILSYVTPYRGRLALNFLFNLLTAASSLISFSAIVPFLKILFDSTSKKEATVIDDDSGWLDRLNVIFEQYIREEGAQQALLVFCGTMVVLFLLRNLFRYLALHQMAYLRNAAVRDIRNKIYQKLLRLPMGYYTEERKGHILSRMTNEVSEIEWSVMGSIEALFREPPMIILYFSSLVAISWQLTLFVLVLLPLTGLIVGRIGKSLKKTAKESQKELGEVVSAVEETVGGIRIVKGFTVEDRFWNRFQVLNNGYFRLMVRLFRKQYLASPLGELISVSTIAMILWFGGNLVLEGRLLNGEFFILYIVIFSQLLSPARGLSEALVRAQRGIAASERIDEILLADERVLEIEQPKPVKGFQNSLEFKNVTFSYLDEPVLKNIQLTIQKGESIALVGPSGGGKSTLVDLLPRFYDIQEGQLLMDGVPLGEYEVFPLRSLFGIVSQKSILFNDTIRGNLQIGNENATEAEMIEALKVANAYDFVMALPDGLDTNIGEGGNKLSGGQQQRMSIARAVLKDPPILIFDEATSALDTESERLVQDALNKLMVGRTSFVIAHRLSTVQHVKRIIVLEKGEVVQEGTHDELIAQEGLYKRLVELQELGS